MFPTEMWSDSNENFVIWWLFNVTFLMILFMALGSKNNVMHISIVREMSWISVAILKMHTLTVHLWLFWKFTQMKKLQNKPSIIRVIHWFIQFIKGFENLYKKQFDFLRYSWQVNVEMHNAYLSVWQSYLWVQGVIASYFQICVTDSKDVWPLEGINSDQLVDDIVILRPSQT